jgi:hypothetical protein
MDSRNKTGRYMSTRVLKEAGGGRDYQNMDRAEVVAIASVDRCHQEPRLLVEECGHCQSSAWHEQADSAAKSM